MKVTVCELTNNPAAFGGEWEALVKHVQAERSDLVLLPEMPFADWFARADAFDAAVWEAAVAAHEQWLGRLWELAPAVVLGSRPVAVEGERLNEGFVWEPEGGYTAAHHKYYLPEEEDFWEATWYGRGEKAFGAVQSRQARIGFLICTEMWFTEHARHYGSQGIDILAVPRATDLAVADKWLAGGRVAAVMSGAYCLSSNRGGFDHDGFAWGGQGWIIEPDQGAVLGTTTPDAPFLTLEIDMQAAELAKHTYPRYVAE